MTDPAIVAARDELHAANNRLGWFVGGPGQRHGGQWEQYAFDPKEKVHIGRRSREWTAVGQTEEECIREMTRCLREIGEGRVPEVERREGPGRTTAGGPPSDIVLSSRAASHPR